MAIDGKSNFLVTVDQGVSALLWNLESRSVAPSAVTDRNDESSIGPPAVSDDGSLVAVPDGLQKLTVWSPHSGQVRTFMRPPGFVRTGAFDRSKRWFASAGSFSSGLTFHPTVSIWDLLDDKVNEGFQLKDANGNAESLAFSPDGHRLAAGILGTVKIWDLSNGKPQSPAISLHANPKEFSGAYLSSASQLRFLDNGKRLRVAGVQAYGGRDGLRVYDWDLTVDPPTARRVFFSNYPVYSVGLSSDGAVVATGHFSGDISVWHLDQDDPDASRQIVQRHDRPVTYLSFSNDKKWLAATERESETNTGRLLLHRMDDLKGTPIELLESESNKVAGVFASGTSKLAATHTDGTVRVWDVNPRELVASVSRLTDRELTWSERKRFGADEVSVVGTQAAFESAADFESDDLPGWERTGSAFDSPIITESAEVARLFKQFEGVGFLSSKAGGVEAVGTLTSPKFRISRDWINLLVAGGKDSSKTSVQLLIDGKPVRHAVGFEYGGTASWELNASKVSFSENRHIYHEWRSWKVTELIGQEAQIKIIDHANRKDDEFGFISCDHIIQSWWKLEVPIVETDKNLKPPQLAQHPQRTNRTVVDAN